MKAIAIASLFVAASFGAIAIADEASDREMLRALDQSYALEWLEGDAKGVMALFTDDATLVPHHGDTPIVGKEAIEKFWFNPEYSPTVVPEWRREAAEILVLGDVGVIRGRSRLVWEYEGTRTTIPEGNYVMIAVRSAAGWRIRMLTWNDDPREWIQEAIDVTDAQSLPGAALRSFNDDVLRSTADPAMNVRIARDFEYLGPDVFLLGDTHEAERHHFVKRDGNEVTALLVFQFERILDGVPGQYQFGIPPEDRIAGSNYRFAPAPVRLGSHDYIHNTWAFDNRESARENPGKESDRTLRLLEKHGYKLDDGLIMARYVRAVGDDERKEIIIFYMEPLRQKGHDLSDFPDGGPVLESYDRLSSAIVALAESAFEVLSDE